MRISDWSSDVCSSDLASDRRVSAFVQLGEQRQRDDLDRCSQDTENNIRHQKKNSRIDHRIAVPAQRSPEITTDRQVEQVETETDEHPSQPVQNDQGGRWGKATTQIKQTANILPKNE